MSPWVLNLQKELQCTLPMSRQAWSQCAGGLWSPQEHIGMFCSNLVELLLAGPFAWLQWQHWTSALWNYLADPLLSPKAYAFLAWTCLSSVTDIVETALRALDTPVLSRFVKMSLKINTVLRGNKPGDVCSSWKFNRSLWELLFVPSQWFTVSVSWILHWEQSLS